MERFLDAFQYNAITGTCDALWVGLTVLTLTGISPPPSRAATSLLTAAGLAELAVPERGEFVARAVRLAQTRRQLREMREHIRNTGRGSPLFHAQARPEH